jgi:hypothetical protein
VQISIFGIAVTINIVLSYLFLARQNYDSFNLQPRGPAYVLPIAACYRCGMKSQ